MSIPFSEILYDLRKNAKMTQEQLAEKLGVSFQAVSKWEHNQACPDIGLLPAIADIFQTDIDTLFGYQSQKLNTTHYNQKYQDEEYYWGNQVWEICYEVLRRMPPVRPLRLLDIGCGEGQAAVFFAKNGYLVSAFDLSESGIKKGRHLAELNGVSVDFFQADMLNYRLETSFDIIFSSGALQYIPENKKEGFIHNLKENTTTGGIHILNVFVDKPFIEPAPDWEEKEYFWKTGELFRFYHDWKIELMEETIFDCDSSGVPHKHCMDVMIARKMV